MKLTTSQNWIRLEEEAIITITAEDDKPVVELIVKEETLTILIYDPNHVKTMVLI